MATVTQTVVSTPSYVPYERPPQPLTLWSAIPRGLQSFIVPLTVLDLKAINDTQILVITATLPPNFGYVMNAAAFSITQDRAVDWTVRCNLNLQNFYRAPVDLSISLASNWVQEFSAGISDSTRHMRVTQAWPTFPIIGSTDTSGALVVLNARNGTATAASAGTLTAFLSFWQFDLEQIRKFPINSPIPTHSR